jgi:hypothetical protein
MTAIEAVHNEEVHLRTIDTNSQEAGRDSAFNQKRYLTRIPNSALVFGSVRVRGAFVAKSSSELNVPSYYGVVAREIFSENRCGCGAKAEFSKDHNVSSIDVVNDLNVAARDSLEILSGQSQPDYMQEMIDKLNTIVNNKKESDEEDFDVDKWSAGLV